MATARSAPQDSTTDRSPTIGIVTALECENDSMFFMFDSPPIEYRGPHPKGDFNHYKLGKIGGKNAALVQLPVGEVGEAVAAATVSHLYDVFDTIEIVFMVGVAGGVPNPDYDENKVMEATTYIRPHVRKGDSIVSYPIANDGPAFLQYDYGKICAASAATNFKQNLKHTHIIKLTQKGLNAAREFKNELKRGNTNSVIDLINERMQQQDDTCQKEFCRPKEDKDILAEGEHPDEPRYRRPEVPKVHFGVMASANSVMRSAEIRDEIAKAENVIGFEMENSGVASATRIVDKGCMFVRGVCDYADEHKDKTWQRYASLVAAATATRIIEKLQ